MNYIGVLYTTFFVFLGLDFLVQYLLYGFDSLLFVMRIIFWSMYFILSSNIIITDARVRGISSLHSLWSLLGIIGVLLYHLIFCRLHELDPNR